jgi:hypothetical protein
MPRTNGSSTERGYGSKHRAERAKWVPKVKRGGVDCARCGQAIEPDEPWDLGHTDDRQGYVGPEHRDCNRADGARKRNAGRRRPVPEPRPWTRPSREW